MTLFFPSITVAVQNPMGGKCHAYVRESCVRSDSRRDDRVFVLQRRDEGGVWAFDLRPFGLAGSLARGALGTSARGLHGDERMERRVHARCVGIGKRRVVCARLLPAVNAAGTETIVERDDYSGGVAKGTCMWREDNWGAYIPGSDWGFYIPTQNTDLYSFEGGALKLWVGRYPNRMIHPDTLRWPRASVPSDTVRFVVRAEVQCFGNAVFQIGGDAWLAPSTLWNPPTSNVEMCCSRWAQASDGRFVLTTPLELHEVL